MGASTNATAGTAQVACINCRQRHQKCDGNIASCERCARSNLICQYVPSRRGLRFPPEREPQFLHATSLEPSTPADLWYPHVDLNIHQQANLDIASPDILVSDGSFGVGDFFPSFSLGDTQLCDDYRTETFFIAHDTMSIDQPILSRHDVPSQGDFDTPLIQSYYMYFHPSHPLLPPLKSLLRLKPPHYLLRTMEFTALHYVSRASTDLTRREIVPLVYNADDAVEKVQALIILSIVLHSRDEPKEARYCLAQAIQLAFKLNMHHKHFAEESALGDLVREESSRRTWWELFIVDVTQAALQFGSTLIINLDRLESFLPCEEESFCDELSVLESLTLKDLEGRAFSKRVVNVSSYAYRIEACILLRDVLGLTRAAYSCPQTYKILDAKITGWFYHLSGSHRGPISSDGKSNEMIIQAIMLVHCASIFLSLPGPLLGKNDIRLPFSHLHTAKAAKAAIGISELSCLPVPASSHTPFYTCFLVLSSVTQLVICLSDRQHLLEKYVPFLSMNIGVLKSLRSIWPIAAGSSDRIQNCIWDFFRGDSEDRSTPDIALPS
ncbi:Fungal transcriptional regulatory protein, N-terminal [Penicillium camemberti]|uniref:Fungal transcriptional regulatory protein, N-terminal n=1 Tax=Penicillium camemberti (strain FM 013) TaxID=1429867 RepID=A0A0G4PHH8_PENC3|nr:Fungal transcriptional regulatory protein, N-terminal [Penicillium camemberti]